MSSATIKSNWTNWPDTSGRPAKMMDAKPFSDMLVMLSSCLPKLTTMYQLHFIRPQLHALHVRYLVIYLEWYISFVVPNTLTTIDPFDIKYEYFCVVFVFKHIKWLFKIHTSIIVAGDFVFSCNLEYFKRIKYKITLYFRATYEILRTQFSTWNKTNRIFLWTVEQNILT